jgi:hypothetical protein
MHSYNFYFFNVKCESKAAAAGNNSTADICEEVTGLSAWVGTAITDVTLLQQILVEGST